MRFIYLCLFFSLLSCSTKSDKCSDSENYLKEFAKGSDEKLPPANPFINFFLRLDNNKIGQFNNIILQHLYYSHYKDELKFDDFICSLYHNKLILDEAVLKEYESELIIFKLDEKIFNLSIQKLTTNFCTEKGSNLILNNNLSDDVKMSVLYTFFKKRYFITFNDSNGYYIISNSLK